MKIWNKIKSLPIAFLFFGGLALLSLVLQIVFRLSTAFSDFFNSTVAFFFRFLLAKLTVLIPFSLAECLLVFVLPLLIAFLVVVCVHPRLRKWRKKLLYVCFSIPLLLYTLFVFTFAAGYSVSGLPERMGIEEKPVSAESLYDTAVWLLSEINALEEDVAIEAGKSSTLPISFEEMNESLLRAYEKVALQVDGMKTYKTKAKPILLSRPMVYTHITGVYSFFTGEANVNVSYPDYVTVYTVAHELAHQRGIAREDEANFIAFLVCISADHPYIRYCGYLNLFEYVFSALRSADAEKYKELAASINLTIYSEWKGYSDFRAQFTDNAVGKISESVNDAYLTVQGTEGVKSYGLVVDLAVAYYQNRIE